MKVAPGVLCEIVGGALHPSPNLGKIVEVIKYQGEHTLHGPIWQCKFPDSNGITEYGVVANLMDFAEDWLKPIPKQTKENVEIDSISV